MKRALPVCVCLLLSFTLLLASCRAKDSSAPLDRDVLNVCLGPTPSSLDPAHASDAAGGSIMLHIFEGLYIMDAQGSPIPAQAESMSVDSEGLVYSFTLRDGLKWSNGEQLRAKDFVYSWNRAVRVAGTRGRSDLFSVFARDSEGDLAVSAPDDRTLVVKLKEKTPYFTELLTLPTFYPVYEPMVRYDSDGWSIKPDACIGNGAYKLEDVGEKTDITLIQNPNYRAASGVKIGAIRFAGNDEGSAYDAFRNGELLFTSSIPNTRIAAASEREDYYGDRYGSGTYYLLLNAGTDPLKKAAVREALILAIDRSYIATELCGGANIPSSGLIPPGMLRQTGESDYRERHPAFFEAAAHEANVARAKELLKDAGYSEEGKSLSVITCRYNKSDGNTLILKAVQHNWAEIGVTLRLEATDWDAITQSAKSGSYQMLQMGWMADRYDPAAMLAPFMTGNAQNLTGYSNKKLDKALVQAQAAADVQGRSAAFYEAESALMEDWILCPIFYYATPYLQSKYLTGAVVFDNGYKSFVNAEIK